MQSKIELYGLEDEILRLFKDGIKRYKIRDKLLEVHPIEHVPSTPRIYDFLNNYVDSPTTMSGVKYGSRHYSQDFRDIYKEIDIFMQKAHSYCSADKKADFNLDSKIFKKQLKEFMEGQKEYGETVEQMIRDWGNEAVGGLCSKCQDFARNKALEIVKRLTTEK